MKIAHFVKVYWQLRRPDIDKAWLALRMNFFRRWTQRSLEAQTCQDFKLWHCCDRAIADMDLSFPEIPGRTVITFGGDTDRAWPVPDDCTHVYVTRLDSDDLYAPDALELVRKVDPTRGASVFRRGYMHDIRDGRTGAYLNRSSPFHTLMFTRDEFASAETYAQKFVGDHSKVAAAYPNFQQLPDWKFAVLVHGNNFLSTFNYAREEGAVVPAGWTPERFINTPVVFDVDDFCDQWNCLAELDKIKAMYPFFCCTLFTIPMKTSPSLIAEATSRPWIELAVHGFQHEPLNEMTKMDQAYIRAGLQQLDGRYVKGFRPPGWYLTQPIIDACNDAGYWLALHYNERDKGKQVKAGWYACDERWPAAHFHSHDTCNNWLKSCLPELATKWPENQAFAKVSEAVLKPT